MLPLKARAVPAARRRHLMALKGVRVLAFQRGQDVTAPQLSKQVWVSSRAKHPPCANR